MECCKTCKGSAPHFICRHSNKCACHTYLDQLAQNTPIPDSHRDPTVHAALWRLSRRK